MDRKLKLYVLYFGVLKMEKKMYEYKYNIYI